jgi:DNA-binding NarL/FixJ family response regulator
MKAPHPVASPPPRVFLVDDHPMLVAGLRSLVENDAGCAVCGVACSAGEALEKIRELRPDLVIMDITLPDRSGLDLLKDLQAIRSDLPVLIFSMHDEMLYAERVVRAGARGYLVKGCDASEFVKAIWKVLGGSLHLSDRVSRHILDRLSPAGTSSQGLGQERLTGRELEVFQLLGEGMQPSHIAAQLQISPRTVDAHRNHIRVKLALPDAQAVLREAVVSAELGRSQETAETAGGLPGRAAGESAPGI